jgi:ATP-dependent RNA helicase RhlE
MKNTTFHQLELSDTTLAAVDAAGYTNPTEIQHRAIPELLAGRDVLGTAQTGTGKTAAFVLPMLERLAPAADRGGPRPNRQHGGGPSAARPRALILTPTRELAVQIVESVQTYGSGSSLACLAVFGGASKNRQIDELRARPDILVATPGRLLDLISERYIDLAAVEYLVLDEADRMLDMGFIPSVRTIVGMTPNDRQTALFSATMPPPIEKLANDFLRKPARVAAEAGEVRVHKIDQSVMYVDQADKLQLLPKLIRDRGMFRVLVFTRTKHRARKVAKVLLKEDLQADAIHGDKSQSARLRALENFRSGKTHVLVATDVASRGIDVDDITHVVNFEIPNEPESYVHRIGRTARAGTEGTAISLCDTTEMPYIASIEKLMGVRIAVDADQPYHRHRESTGAPHGARKPTPQSSGRRGGRATPRGARSASAQGSGRGSEESSGSRRRRKRSGGGRSRSR